MMNMSADQLEAVIYRRNVRQVFSFSCSMMLISLQGTFEAGGSYSRACSAVFDRTDWKCGWQHVDSALLD